MPSSDHHFARVEPIVGDALRSARVALLGLPAAAPIVIGLAACGLGRWIWESGEQASDKNLGHIIFNSHLPTPISCSETLLGYLRAQHGAALALDVALAPLDGWEAELRCAPPDLIIAVGNLSIRQRALALARATGCPALLIAPPAGAAPCQALMAFPDDSAWQLEALAQEMQACSGDAATYAWDWITAAPLCAGLARAILLRDTPYRRDDLAALWDAGVRVALIGGAHPFDLAWRALDRTDRAAACAQANRFITPAARRGTLLIAGLGSLGSIAALHLPEYAAGFVLADPELVDVANPARQAYPRAAIGRPKAQALREQLCAAGAGPVVALSQALRDERVVAELAERYPISAALVVTGSGDDYAIARALRARNIPHVVGRCYPRARYWEAIVVDGGRGPALSDIRGHVTPGPAAALTPEQRAAYSDAGALEAEPATLIESGWAAAWLARLAAQLLAPAGLRERWMLELLAAEHTCILGGVGVEPTEQGAAYAIELPGQLRAWASASIGPAVVL